MKQIYEAGRNFTLRVVYAPFQNSRVQHFMRQSVARQFRWQQVISGENGARLDATRPLARGMGGLGAVLGG